MQVSGLKLFDDALKKHSNDLTNLHEDIIRRGGSISRVSLWKLQQGKIRSIKPNILALLVDIAYNGDWEKAGKVINADK